MTKHSTSTISRPQGIRDTSDDAVRPPQDDAPGDHTRLIQRRRNRQFFGLGVTLIIAALIGALLVLPIRAWQNQRQELADRQRELTALETANGRLQTENDRLQTAEGVEAAARGDYAFRDTDEFVVGVLPAPPPSAQFPAGWPYSAVSDILNVRATLATEAAAVAAASSTTQAPIVDPTIAPATSEAAGTTAAPVAPEATVAATAPDPAVATGDPAPSPSTTLP